MGDSSTTPVQNPSNRALGLPFTIGYNSNQVNHMQALEYPYYGRASWRGNEGYLSQGGWSYSVPMVSFTWSSISVDKNPGGMDPPTAYQCESWDNYMFEGHSLGIGTQFSSPYNSGSCPLSSYSRRLGGDGQVLGFLPDRKIEGPYYNPYATPPSPVTVLKPDGTVYKFPDSYAGSGRTHLVNGTQYLLPDVIEDRNGNKITFTDTGISRSVGKR